jgi:hypothetical protein
MIDKDLYTFSRTNSEGNTVSITMNYNDDTTWHIVLQDFIKFLELCGYVGVNGKVSAQDSPFLSDDWYGPVHPAPEDADNVGW